MYEDSPVPPYAVPSAFVRFSVLAVRVVPLNVKLAESCSNPPVPAYVTRPEVRPESVIALDVTLVNPANVVVVFPRATVVLPIVTGVAKLVSS